MSFQPEKRLTPEEYLSIERRAQHRSEYFAGEMFAMAGASRRHNRIVTNVVVGLDNQLKDRPCNLYSSDMRVMVSSTGLYTYPDVVVTCGEEQFADEHEDNLLNPLVIIEVLSESTEAYDRGRKFEHYQQIESLREYLLIAQDQWRIEQYLRQNTKQWLYSETHEVEEFVRLASIDCELILKDIYAKVEPRDPPTLR
jgi:Uma2 family endonuclease